MPNLSFDYPKLKAHPRFKALAKRLGGDEGRALDCVLGFWNTAQEYYGKGRRPVPLKVFRLVDDWAHLIEVDFAELREDCVAANGAGTFFEWYAEIMDGAHKGGLASAEARRRKYGSAVPLGASNSEATPNCPRSDPSSSARTGSEDFGPNRSEATEPLPNPITITSSSTQGSKEPLDISPPKSPPDPEDEALARDWFAFASQNSKTVRFSAKWASAVEHMRRLDGLSIEELRAALDFVRHDSFWRVNALSLPSLRSRSKNGVLKIENLLNSMRSEQSRSGAGESSIDRWLREEEAKERAAMKEAT